KTDQKAAYDAAKLYLDNCPADPADKQAEYMREKFVKPYEALQGQQDVAKKFETAVTSKNYRDQITIGKQILEKDPDNAPVNILMGVAGLNDPSILPDSAAAAKKAISLIESGKPFA